MQYFPLMLTTCSKSHFNQPIIKNLTSNYPDDVNVAFKFFGAKCLLHLPSLGPILIKVTKLLKINDFDIN